MKTGKTYHVRRVDKEITDRAAQMAIIRSQKILTMALCKENEPYLVTLDYGYSESENCFYLHAATEGKKVDFLRANPRIWGQIVDDRGYMAGKCSHAYRCLMFWGQAEFVQDAAEKRRALVLMCEQLEPNPASVAHKLVGPFDNVAILRLRVEGMTAKESPPPKKG